MQALLGGGLPTVAGTEGLLATVDSLLGTAGVDTSTLQGLLAAARIAAGSAAPGPGATALQTVIGTIGGLLGATTSPVGGTTTPSTTPPSTTPPKPGATIPRPGGTTAKPGAGFTAYRASIGSVKVAKNRKRAKIRISCPAIAPRGCLVTLRGVVAGKKAFKLKPFILVRNVSRTFTVKLGRTTTSRLRKKGGSMKVTAATSFSTLRAVSKSVKVARSAKH